MCGVAWVISWYKRVADKSGAKTKNADRQRRYGGRGLMKAEVLLSLVLLCVLAGLLAARPLRAPTLPRRQPATCQPICSTSESPLPKVAEAIKAGKPLEILVIGSRSSTIQRVGGQRLSGADAGRAAGEAAAVSGQRHP